MLNPIVLSKSKNSHGKRYHWTSGSREFVFLTFFDNAVHSKVRGFLEATLSIYMRDWTTCLQETG